MQSRIDWSWIEGSTDLNKNATDSVSLVRRSCLEDPFGHSFMPYTTTLNFRLESEFALLENLDWGWAFFDNEAFFKISAKLGDTSGLQGLGSCCWDLSDTMSCFRSSIVFSRVVIFSFRALLQQCRQTKGSCDEARAWNVHFGIPAHVRWNHPWQLPSQKRESWPLDLPSASLMALSHTKQTSALLLL